MKRSLVYFWYAMTAVGIAGLFLKWEWVNFWFPLFALTTAQLTRIRLGLPENIFDRIYGLDTRKYAILSVAIVMFSVTSYVMWLIYVDQPAREAADVEEFRREYQASKLNNGGEP